MVSAVCLTLGLIYIVVWAGRREDWAKVCFAVTAVGVAALALFELLLMQASSVEAYARLHRWGHVSVFFIIIGLVSFVRLYFRAGAWSLLWLIVALRCAVLAANYFSPVSASFLEITSLESFPLFGEVVNVPVGIANPWSRLAEISLVLVALFTLQAALEIWRRNEPRDRQRAAVIGSAVVLFFSFALANALLVHHSPASVPYFLSMAFMVVVLAMTYELSIDIRHASETVRELDKSKARVELAAESAGVGFWEYDAEHDRFWVTDRVRELFGFDPHQQLDMAVWLDRVHPDDREVADKSATEFIAQGNPFRLDYRVRRPAGEVRWVTAQGRQAAKAGRIFHGLTMDVTAQHESEHERSQLRDQLAHSGRVTMLGQMAASLAHELNQPLGAILRNAEAAQLLLDVESPDLAELREILKDVQRDDRRAGEVIGKLRGLLKQHSFDSRRLNLELLVDEVMSLVRTEAAVRGTKIHKEFEPGPAFVAGDPIHLQQVLLNLVLNALDVVEAMPEGKRWVRIGARRRDDGFIEVSVCDSGSGVPPGMAEQIFSPFFTTKPAGMGLGLSICRTIVEVHGGRIWVDTEAVGGASFCFTLPLQVRPAAS